MITASMSVSLQQEEKKKYLMSFLDMVFLHVVELRVGMTPAYLTNTSAFDGSQPVDSQSASRMAKQGGTRSSWF